MLQLTINNGGNLSFDNLSNEEVFLFYFYLYIILKFLFFIFFCIDWYFKIIFKRFDQKIVFVKRYRSGNCFLQNNPECSKPM